MNPHIVNLVLKYVTESNLCWTKDRNQEDTWVIYDSNIDSEKYIMFEDYVFHLLKYSEGKETLIKSYDSLHEAIEGLK